MTGTETGGAHRAPTITDVARRAGVSTGAVSSAMHDRPGVSDGTRRRIRSAAAELGWRPHDGARSLTRDRARTVGLVLAAGRLLDGNDFVAPFVTALEQALAAADDTLLLRTVADGDRAQVAAYRRIWERHVLDAVVVTDVADVDPRLELLAATDLAVVVVDHLTGMPGRDRFLTLDHDQAAGIHRAVRHLIALGHRRVAFVGGPAELRHVAERRAAWQSALAGAGLRPGPTAHDESTAAGGARATTEVLLEDPTAIVYSADLMAIGGLGAIRDAGIRVPTDISVVGFDDIRLAAHLSPALTTVRVDYAALGEATAAALLAALAEEPAPPPPPIPVELVTRASTAPPNDGRR